MGLRRIDAFWANGPALTVLECCNCGVSFAITQELERRRRDDKKNFYCPNGHSQWFPGESSEQKRIRELEQQVAREKQAAESERRSRQWAESRAKGAAIQAGKAKAAQRRLEQRVAHGVCPCCHRTFKQLAAHMKTKHPGYRKSEPPR